MQGLITAVQCELSFLKRTLTLFSLQNAISFSDLWKRKAGEKTRQRRRHHFFLPRHTSQNPEKKKTETRRNRNRRDPSFPPLFSIHPESSFLFRSYIWGKRREEPRRAPKFANIPVSSLPWTEAEEGQTDRQKKRKNLGCSPLLFLGNRFCPLFCGRGFAKILILKSKIIYLVVSRQLVITTFALAGSVDFFQANNILVSSSPHIDFLVHFRVHSSDVSSLH